jgi:hypothetical protein
VVWGYLRVQRPDNVSTPPSGLRDSSSRRPLFRISEGIEELLLLSVSYYTHTAGQTDDFKLITVRKPLRTFLTKMTRKKI